MINLVFTFSNEDGEAIMKWLLGSHRLTVRSTGLTKTWHPLAVSVQEKGPIMLVKNMPEDAPESEEKWPGS